MDTTRWGQTNRIGEYIRGGPTPREVLSKRLQREWMERTQHQREEAKNIVENVQQLTEKKYKKLEASTTGGTYNKTTARHDIGGCNK